MESPIASSARGFAYGEMFNRKGEVYNLRTPLPVAFEFMMLGLWLITFHFWPACCIVEPRGVA